MSDKNVSDKHFVCTTGIRPPFPTGLEQAIFGMGCFWGAERCFWTLQGVYTTAVGYAGGSAVEPDYQQVCSGATGHAEVVLVVFDPRKISYKQLLQQFWESHDPTQGMRQGNDVGSQYRSLIHTFGERQVETAHSSREYFQSALTSAGYGNISTEIEAADRFWYAEDYHQQYLAKNPGGYCGLGGTGISMPESIAR